MKKQEKSGKTWGVFARRHMRKTQEVNIIWLPTFEENPGV